MLRVYAFTRSSQLFFETQVTREVTIHMGGKAKRNEHAKDEG